MNAEIFRNFFEEFANMERAALLRLGSSGGGATLYLVPSSGYKEISVVRSAMATHAGGTGRSRTSNKIKCKGSSSETCVSTLHAEDHHHRSPDPGPREQ